MLKRFALRVFRALDQFVCGLSGHDYIKKMEANRISLCCSQCQRNTPGWVIDDVQEVSEMPEGV